MARSFFAPDATHPANATFGNVSALSGYDVALLPNRRVALTLYWRALEPAQTSYKVFVHLIADDNSLLAQNDSEPAVGLRPTTSWAAGEYVKDEHIINLTSQVKPGTYRLEVGLYDPTSGERLSITKDNTEQEKQRVILATIVVN